MAKVKVLVDSTAFDKQIADVQKYVDETLIKQMVKEYKKNTPVGGPPPAGTTGGNARRNTKRKGNSVVGDYAYAGVLDDGLFPRSPKGGYGKTTGGYSKQATRGMAEPTLIYVEDKLEDFIKRSNK